VKRLFVTEDTRPGSGRLKVAMAVIGTFVILATVAGGSFADGRGPAATLVQLGSGDAPAQHHRADSDCVACHQFNSTLSHPVGQRPSQPLGSEFPLVDGRVACITCHDVETKPSPTLRGTTSGAGFCTECHDGTPTNRAVAHGQGSGRAHLSAGHSTRGGNGRVLDSESQNCMTCHDGIGAGDAGTHAGRLGRKSVASDHPIGVKHRSRSARAGAEELRLVSPRGLDPRVRLFDEMVGCGSCHSVYSRHDDLLVMSNQQSQLCFKCHIE
jgi:predicted CXXCH cytochrome family protein